MGNLNCVRNESLITIETKIQIHGKSFAVANKSTKTAKIFHSETFALYGKQISIISSHIIGHSLSECTMESHGLWDMYHEISFDLRWFHGTYFQCI